ncbi:MAG TPA: hypothetical protein VN081_06935 [Dongiaceae bacterium]|nr:hypothetical protein [Dongiaceae bacterium]
MADFDPSAVGAALTGFMRAHPYSTDTSWDGNPDTRPWWINPDNNADQSGSTGSYQPWLKAGDYALQFNSNSNPLLAKWSMADPNGNPLGYYDFTPDANGNWTGAYHERDNNWFDGLVNGIGDITPAITTALIAFITGGAAAGAMGGAGGAAGGVGATEGGGGMAGAGTASGGLGETAGGFSSLPAGGMGATGELGSLGAGGTVGADYGALGSGMYGTGDAAMGNLMGTSGGAFPMGSGLAGVTSADLAASGSGIDWASQARRIAQQLMNNNQPTAAMGSGGGGMTGTLGSPGISQTQQNNYQSPDLMPKFSIAAGGPTSPDELNNSTNIRMLAQRLRGNNGY